MASTCADMDGDGIPDFIVGKRFFSHHESYTDPDPMGPAVLYVYKTVRNKNAPGGAEFVPELVHNASGAGSQITAMDLNKDGINDIATSGELGAFVFLARRGRAPGRRRLGGAAEVRWALRPGHVSTGRMAAMTVVTRSPLLSHSGL